MCTKNDYFSRKTTVYIGSKRDREREGERLCHRGKRN